MKEKDIREHINAFLRSKLQHLVVPASMGLGLMVGGCDGSSLSASPDGAGGTPSTYPSGGILGAQGGLYGMPGFGGAGGTSSSGGSGAGGTLYGSGGFPSGGSGGAGGTSAHTGRGGVYGFPVTGGRGGASPAGGRGAGGIGGTSSSGIRGVGGTVYGTGIFRDAAQPSDAATRGEVSESEAGASSDALMSEAGAVDTEKDAGRDER